MEKPLITIGSKEFQSGISMMGAHAERGGLFYKAAGITPLFDAGASMSANNGLLMAGAAGTLVSGTLGGSVMNSIAEGGINTIFQSSTANGMIMACSDNKIYKLLLSGGVPSGSLSAALTVANTLTGGLVVFTDSTNIVHLFYRQSGHIGRYTPSGPTQTDTWQAATTDYFGTLYVHYGLNKIIFGNGAGKIGTIASDLTVNLSALTFDAQSVVSALSDDGVYVIAAITRNLTADPDVLVDSRIVFWDGSVTTGFLRDYPITDPLIYSIQKTPVGVFAFGLTGIWQVSFDGVKKIFSHSPGMHTATGASVIHYGRATSFFSDALIWGGQVGSSTARAVKSLGKLDSAALLAYLHPILGTASKNITRIDGQISKGYIFVADDTPQLKYYPVGSGTPQTGVSAQSIYLSFAQPVDITHIDVVFGEPLASGDTLDLDVFRDEDNAVTDFGSVSYDSAKTIRRFQFKNQNGGALSVDQQISLLLTFTSGAVKIKYIEVFGQPKERTNV